MSFELRKLGESKAGILGGFIGMFVATIAVVLILLIFVFISGFVKILSRDKVGVEVRGLKETGIDNIYSYSDSFVKIVKIRYFMGWGRVLPAAIKEGGYEEK